MARSLKLSLSIIGLATLAWGGFVWGRTLGAQTRLTHGRRGISAMLPFHPSLTAGVGDPEPNPHVPPDQVFEDVLDKVQQNFVDGSNNNARLSNGALSRMLASLDDSKTSYLDLAYRESRQDALKGRYHGIGAVLSVVKSKKSDVEYRQLTLVDVMPGSPAEKAGLRSRDIITHIDDRWIITYAMSVEADRITKKTHDEDERSQEIKAIGSRFQKGYNLTKALGLLSTGESKTLKLTYIRPGQAMPMTIAVKTGLTEVDPIEYRVLAGRIAYLRVRQFNARATHQFQLALDSAVAMGSMLRGIIVDLRGNPGGVRAEAAADVDGFASARKLLARLTRGGPVATLERRPNVREALSIVGAKPALALPRVVLVDQGTANIAEMAAAALHDSGAKIMGTHTFGDDVLQLFTVFKSGGGIEMTSAHLLTTGGVDLSKGIEPDYPLTAAETANEGIVKMAMLKLGV